MAELLITLELNEEDNPDPGTEYVTTGTPTPVADTLYIVFVSMRSDSGAWDTDPVLTGMGMSSWSLHATKAVAFNDRITYMFHSVDASPGGSEALTFTAGGVETYKYMMITVLKVVGSTISGTNGIDALIQVKDKNQDAGQSVDTEVIFDSSMTAGNGALAGFGCIGSPLTSTPRSGWTELVDHLISGAMSQVVHWRNDSDDRAIATYGNTGGVRVALMVEIELLLASITAVLGGSFVPTVSEGTLAGN